MNTFSLALWLYIVFEMFVKYKCGQKWSKVIFPLIIDWTFVKWGWNPLFGTQYSGLSWCCKCFCVVLCVSLCSNIASIYIRPYTQYAGHKGSVHSTKILLSLVRRTWKAIFLHKIRVISEGIWNCHETSKFCFVQYSG